MDLRKEFGESEKGQIHDCSFNNAQERYRAWLESRVESQQERIRELEGALKNNILRIASWKYPRKSGIPTIGQMDDLMEENREALRNEKQE